MRCRALFRNGYWEETELYLHTIPLWSDIFECCFKAQSSMLEGLFSLKHGNGDVRALSFELSKMTPQVGLAVYRVTSKKM